MKEKLKPAKELRFLQMIYSCRDFLCLFSGTPLVPSPLYKRLDDGDSGKTFLSEIGKIRESLLHLRKFLPHVPPQNHAANGNDDQGIKEMNVRVLFMRNIFLKARVPEKSVNQHQRAGAKSSADCLQVISEQGHQRSGLIFLEVSLRVLPCEQTSSPANPPRFSLRFQKARNAIKNGRQT